MSVFFWIFCAFSCFIRTIGHIKVSILVSKFQMCLSEIRTLDLSILCPMLYSFATLSVRKGEKKGEEGEGGPKSRK